MKTFFKFCILFCIPLLAAALFRVTYYTGRQDSVSVGIADENQSRVMRDYGHDGIADYTEVQDMRTGKLTQRPVTTEEQKEFVEKTNPNR